MTRGATALAVAASFLAAGPSLGQTASPSGEWNGPRAVELIERARETRSMSRPDSGLSNYRADARGYVYFFLDRNDLPDRTPVRVDQIALEVYWSAPNLTKQRIVGLRDAKQLPNNIHYHLDHLTVVQDEFGDVIRLGDGDEVQDVLHPAAPGSDSLYDFRLADSLTISLSGVQEPIRVYEVEVRPRSLSEPGFIGSVFLDRASAAIVRMTFSFTPASYVDRRLDYIRISLDNGLWEGRYWLPHEQKLEIRRQYPELDFPVGGVIRGELRIGDYRFNEPLPEGLFRGHSVVALPPQTRERFPFREGIFDGLMERGLTEPQEFEQLREKVDRLAGPTPLTGLPKLRLYIPDASSALRYSRAEGVFAGAGLAYRPVPGLRLTLAGGYAIAAGAGEVTLTAIAAVPVAGRVSLAGYAGELKDLEPGPATAGALNTLHAFLAGRDYTDPYRADGVRIRAERGLGALWQARVELRGEEHRSVERAVAHPPLDGSFDFRPVRAVPEGRLVSGTLRIFRDGAAAHMDGWWIGGSAEVGTFEGDAFVRPVVSAGIALERPGNALGASAELLAGAVTGKPPLQRLFFIGGRGTLPGYGFRSFAGDRLLLGAGEAWAELVDPWLRFRTVATAGLTSLDNRAPPEETGLRPADGVRVAVGAGVGIFYDILRLDLVRGLNRGGGWEWILSVHPGLVDFL